MRISRVVLTSTLGSLSGFAAAVYTVPTMTKLNESLHVQVPYVRARAYLHETLDAAAKNRAPELLTLSAFVPATNLELTKEVRVQYEHGTDPMHFDEPWIVRWVPERGGIYPSFDGRIQVCADENYDSSILEISGTYNPPMGAAGRAFDTAIGHTIAATTAQRLLSAIAEEMTARYKSEEAAKADAAST